MSHSQSQNAKNIFIPPALGFFRGRDRFSTKLLVTRGALFAQDVILRLALGAPNSRRIGALLVVVVDAAVDCLLRVPRLEKNKKIRFTTRI